MVRVSLVLSLCLGLALPLSLAACGDDDGGNEVALADFAAQAAEATCSWLFRCCTDQELSDMESNLEAGALADQAACAAYFEPSFATYLTAPIQAAVANGRAEYNPSKTGACLAEAADNPCTGGGQNALQALAQTCQGAYTAKQGEGDACASQVECQAGLQCLDGTCQALLAADSECSTATGSLLCATGLYCDPDAQTCQPRKAADEACSGQTTLECQAGLTCDAETQVCAVVVYDTCTGR